MLNEDEPVDPPLTLVNLPHGLPPDLIGLFGVVATRVTVVEFQNRGAAHVHGLVFGGLQKKEFKE